VTVLSLYPPVVAFGQCPPPSPGNAVTSSSSPCTVHEESPDGAVQIVLTATGRLDRITLTPWALRLGPERLAGVIAETIQRAHHAAGDQVEAALRPLLRWSHRDVPAGQAFGDLVRAFRRSAGLSQDDLAVRAGLGVRGLRKIETRQISSPRPATVLLLADALGLTGHDRERFFTAAAGPE
jgi:hypothetical protein